MPRPSLPMHQEVWVSIHSRHRPWQLWCTPPPHAMCAVHHFMYSTCCCSIHPPCSFSSYNPLGTPTCTHWTIPTPHRTPHVPRAPPPKHFDVWLLKSGWVKRDPGTTRMRPPLGRLVGVPRPTRSCPKYEARTFVMKRPRKSVARIEGASLSQGWWPVTSLRVVMRSSEEWWGGDVGRGDMDGQGVTQCDSVLGIAIKIYKLLLW